MKARLLGAIATAALLASFSSAQAAMVEVTYTGTVATSSDPNGVFGPAGDNNIFGALYQVSYLFNTSLGQYSSNPPPATPPNSSSTFGGTIYSFPSITSPSLGATVTINGVSETIGGQAYAYMYAENDAPTSTYSYQQHIAEDLSSSTTLYDYANTNNSMGDYSNALPWDISAPVNYTATIANGGAGYGTTTFNIYDPSTCNSVNCAILDATITADLTGLTVTVLNSPGPTPGAAGLLGLGLLILAGAVTKAREISASLR